MKSVSFIIVALIVSVSLSAQHDSLRLNIDRMLRSLNAEAGVAIKNLSDGDTLTWNQSQRFPMQSVFKLPLCMYVLNQVDAGKLSMDQKVSVAKSAYYNTWSPIIKKYPQGNVELSLEEILIATLRDSDNLGCDLLFSLVGGTAVVEKYFHALGIKDIAMKHNEQEMQAAWQNQFDNWCTPTAMLEILERIHKRKLLWPSSHDFLWKNMVTCTTGPRRIKGNLPSETTVAHRTGTGGPNAEKVIGAVNDVGIMELPNGNRIALVVFMSRVRDGQSEAEEIISKISRAVYNHYSN